MVHNEFVRCEQCETEMNLRIQVGYVSIPFIYNCPVCHSEVSGKIDINNETPGLSLVDLVNIEKVFTNKIDDMDIMTIELSGEFMTRKMCPRKNVSLITPFMRRHELLGFGENSKKNYYDDATAFMNFEDKKWNNLKTYYSLFWNNKDEVLFPKLLVILKLMAQHPLETIDSRLDTCLVLHHYLIIETGIIRTLPESARNRIFEFPNLVTKSKEQFFDAFKIYGKSDEELSKIEKKALDLIDEYKQFHKYILPIIVEKMAGTFDQIDLEIDGISTVSYEEMKKFYANSFEWILDNTEIIVLLNNCIHRGSGDICSNGKKLSEFKKAPKFQKIDYINQEEQFGILLASLNNKVRNAIQHYDESIDYNDQKITFTNTNSKGKQTTINMYFSEFANLCIDNLIIVIYFYEVLYNYRKLRIISDMKIDKKSSS